MKIQARVLLVPDLHAPFHSTTAWALALRCAKAFNPSNVVILGDFVDFYAVSDHLKNPSVKQDLRKEVLAGKACLRQLNTATSNAVSRVYCAGNHEYRLDRYLARNAPQVAHAVRTDELLGLREAGWEYVPYRSSFRLGKLNITHDIGGAGGAAHTKAAAVYGDNVVIGHVHRMGISYSSTPGGDPHVGMVPGWLGDPDAIDYMHNDVVKATWMHGIGIAYIMENGDAHCHCIPFVNNTALVPTEDGVKAISIKKHETWDDL